jgi:hypothetical protein
MGDQLYLFGAIPLSQPAFIDPGVSYSEASVAAAQWFKGVPGIPFDGFALFGMPIPVENGLVFQDPTTSYAKVSVPATAWTEVEG